MTISNLSIGALLFKPSNRVSEGGKIISLSRLADYWLDKLADINIKFKSISLHHFNIIRAISLYLKRSLFMVL